MVGRRQLREQRPVNLAGPILDQAAEQQPAFTLRSARVSVSTVAGETHPTICARASQQPPGNWIRQGRRRLAGRLRPQHRSARPVVQPSTGPGLARGDARSTGPARDVLGRGGTAAHRSGPAEGGPMSERATRSTTFRRRGMEGPMIRGRWKTRLAGASRTCSSRCWRS